MGAFTVKPLTNVLFVISKTPVSKAKSLASFFVISIKDVSLETEKLEKALEIAFPPDAQVKVVINDVFKFLMLLYVLQYLYGCSH